VTKVPARKPFRLQLGVFLCSQVRGRICNAALIDLHCFR
jgi:hypothetical protein